MTVIKRLLRTSLWLLFVVGLVCCFAAGNVPDGPPRDLATYGGPALSLVTGTLIARKEPIKTFLGTGPVLWFLFLFNLAAAVTVLLLLDGVTGISAAAGLGLVSLGAGGSLLLRRRRS
ncbi:hypothetical protein [Actinoplanes sp. RD1]|uniref:hypothetical protein n=1 Tax=Actinoplanes sp. RD1 TaxID=3064538 RepID=UPI0027406E01|nr:hypothetical protein [Actinoplanes sp. RD1]